MVPTGKTISKIYQPAVLNGDAAVLVNMMTEDFTVNSIVAQRINIFKVDEAILRKDEKHLINQLMLTGMLEDEEVERRLKSAMTTLSGTAVVKEGKICSSETECIKRFFGDC